MNIAYFILLAIALFSVALAQGNQAWYCLTGLCVISVGALLFGGLNGSPKPKETNQRALNYLSSYEERLAHGGYTNSGMLPFDSLQAKTDYLTGVCLTEMAEKGIKITGEVKENVRLKTRNYLIRNNK